MKTNKFLTIATGALLFTSTVSVTAQAPFRETPTWWYGISGAANFNFYTGSVDKLNQSYLPYTYTKGYGVSPYYSIFAEYRPDPVWGLILDLGLDNNEAVFNSSNAPPGVSTSLKTSFYYVSLEPSLRIAPFGSNFYVFVGPGINYLTGQSYDFMKSPEENDQNKFNDAYPWRLSAQVGAGYEIPLLPATSVTQLNLSPFVAFAPDLTAGTTNSWNNMLLPLRAGITLKIGFGPQPPMPQAATSPLILKDVAISIPPPGPVQGPEVVKETLPITNHIFFDEGSTQIPARYDMLTQQEAASFSEAQLQDCQKTPGTRETRQLTVYHNSLNILGDRMRKNPESTVTLIGSSGGKGNAVGEANANAVKDYLVNVFGIDASRITVKGQSLPPIPSEKYRYSTRDTDLTRAEDNRVDIVSTSPELMVEATDNSALCMTTAKAPADDGSSPGDTRIIVNAPNADASLQPSWTIDVTDESGNVQHFGPFSGDAATLSGEDILNGKTSGNYTITLTGVTILGQPVKKETTLHLTHEPGPVVHEQIVAVLFEFDKSKTADNYADFLTNKVAPLIPSNATVVISGHTDTIGTEEHNMALSDARAKEAENILNTALTKDGKTGIVYKTTGYGENDAPFSNSMPEDRFYNRTVIINITPANANTYATH